MVDAVNGELGRALRRPGRHHASTASATHLAAGKTGTAQLGGEQAPHSWFIGFAPAEDGATPAIAIAVLVESGGSGERPRGTDRRPGHGRVRSASTGRRA